MFTVAAIVLNAAMGLALVCPQISFQFYGLHPILRISRLDRLIVRRCAPLILSVFLNARVVQECVRNYMLILHGSSDNVGICSRHTACLRCEDTWTA
jgi:hypothetical protein